MRTILRCKSCLKFVAPFNTQPLHDNINNHNDDKTVGVDDRVEPDNAPENDVGGVF